MGHSKLYITCTIVHTIVYDFLRGPFVSVIAYMYTYLYFIYYILYAAVVYSKSTESVKLIVPSGGASSGGGGGGGGGGGYLFEFPVSEVAV